MYSCYCIYPFVIFRFECVHFFYISVRFITICMVAFFIFLITAVLHSFGIPFVSQTFHNGRCSSLSHVPPNRFCFNLVNSWCSLLTLFRIEFSDSCSVWDFFFLIFLLSLYVFRGHPK